MVANALSRIGAIEASGVDFELIAATQVTLEEIKAYRGAVTGLNFLDVPFGRKTVVPGGGIKCDPEMDNLVVWAGSVCMAFSSISGLRLFSPDRHRALWS